VDNYTEILANQNFDFLQMGEIKKGIRDGVNVSLYANPEYSCYTMRQIRKGLEQGIDMTNYAGYDVGIMCEIRKAILEHSC
jgi:hypothetical protein